jgi:hypothetical protein
MQVAPDGSILSNSATSGLPRGAVEVAGFVWLIEASCDQSGGGDIFRYSPQEGSWLTVETFDSSAMPVGITSDGSDVFITVEREDGTGRLLEIAPDGTVASATFVGRPRNVAISGGVAWVLDTSVLSPQVLAFNTSSMALIGHWPTDATPEGLTPDPEGGVWVGGDGLVHYASPAGELESVPIQGEEAIPVHSDGASILAIRHDPSSNLNSIDSIQVSSGEAVTVSQTKDPIVDVVEDAQSGVAWVAYAHEVVAQDITPTASS